MDKLDKYKQLKITTQKNRLPALPERPISMQKPNYSFKQNLQQRVQELEGSIRMLEKKYKENLKHGFENKIKTYRLQAVIERKIIKSTIESTKKQIEEEQLKQKMMRAQAQKQRSNKRIVSIQQRTLERRRRVRSKAEKQKSEVHMKLQQQNERLILENKQIHDKLMYQIKHNDKKKIYFQSLRKAQNSQQMQRQKKKFISKIIQNKQILDNLKHELAQITKDRKQSSLSQTPFITI